MLRPALLTIAIAAAASTSAGLAFAADGPSNHAPGAHPSAPPAGTLQIVLRPQSFHVVDSTPKRSGVGPPSPGDTSITTYRVFDARNQLVTSAQPTVRLDPFGTFTVPLTFTPARKTTYTVTFDLNDWHGNTAHRVAHLVVR